MLRFSLVRRVRASLEHRLWELSGFSGCGVCGSVVAVPRL